MKPEHPLRSSRRRSGSAVSELTPAAVHDSNSVHPVENSNLRESEAFGTHPSAVPADPKEGTRLRGLDVLRLFAAVIVLFYHYTFRGQFGLMSFSHPAIGSVAKYGYLGVELFFMISGFVILMSVGSRTAWQFLKARILRLYPAFWICVTLTAIVVNYSDVEARTISLRQWMANLTMLPDFFSEDYVSGVYWTLMHEIKFYVFVCLLILCGFRHYFERAFAAWLLLSVIAAASGNHPFVRAVSAMYAPYFVGGSVLYLMSFQGVTRFRVALLAASIALSMPAAWYRCTSIAREYGAPLSPPVSCGILLVLMLLFACSVCGLVKVKWKWSATAGALTYPLYLIHEDIGYVLFNTVGDLGGPSVQLAIVTTSIISIAGCIVVVERPVKQLLRKWLDKFGQKTAIQGS